MNLNTALWVIQIILGIKLLSVSYSHGLRQSQPSIQEAAQGLGRFSRPLLYFASVGTLLGALGLVLPGVLGSAMWIVPVTAAFVSIMLLISIGFHIKSRPKPRIFVGAILLTFAVFVAYGRWVLLPS